MSGPRRWLPDDQATRSVLTCIGLVSDTHLPDRLAELPATLPTILADVDLLLHAGDVGELRVLDQLSAIAPTIAVHGNDDSAAAQATLPYQQVLAIGGQRLFLCHSHHPDRQQDLANRVDDRWLPKLTRRAAVAREAGATIYIYGHTHVPTAVEQDGVLLVNPGALASGNHISRQLHRTVALLFLCWDGPPVVVHVDVQEPDRPFLFQLDWSAGYQASHRQFSDSIFDLALERDWSRIRARLDQLDQSEALLIAGRTIVQRAAQAVWAGQRGLLSHANLVQELLKADDIAEPLRAELERLFTKP